MTPTYQNIGFSEMQLAEQNGIGRFEDDYHRFLMEHGKIDRFDLHHQSDLFRQSPTSHLYDMCQCSESDLDLEFYSSEWITQNALSQIDAWDPKQPELLMVGYINPHHPFDPPAPYSTMYNPDTLHLLPGYLDQPIPFDTQANGTPVDYSAITESEMRSIMAAYYGMITEIDDGIGSIIQKLKEKGLYDNTIIVFTSDHGEYLGYHHMILKCNHLYDPLGKNPAADQISPAAVLRQYRSLSFRKHRWLQLPFWMPAISRFPHPCRGFPSSGKSGGTMFFQKDNTGQSNPPILVICSVPIPTNCSYAAALKMRFYMISKKTLMNSTMLLICLNIRKF